MIGNAKKWKTGALSLPVQLPSGEPITLFAEKGEQTGNTFAVHFSWSSPLEGEWKGSFAEILDAVGELPIPPYLNRESEEIDLTRYQTVYSKFNQGLVNFYGQTQTNGQTLSFYQQPGAFDPGSCTRGLYLRGVE